MAVNRAMIIFLVVLGAGVALLLALAITTICRGRRSGKVDTEGERQQIEYMREVRLQTHREMAAHNGFKYPSHRYVEV